MVQKVIKIGKSIGITLSKHIREESHLKAGDQVTVEFDKKTRKIVVDIPDVVVDQELLNWTEKFIEEYRPALKALAKK